LDLQVGGTQLGLKKTSGYVSVLYVDFIYDARVYKAEPYDAYELSRGYLVFPLFLPLPQGALSKEKFKVLTSIPDSLDSTYSASFLTSLGPGLRGHRGYPTNSRSSRTTVVEILLSRELWRVGNGRAGHDKRADMNGDEWPKF